MKKCKGCGAVLQTEEPQKTGYVVDIDQDYCQRCFRLTHYDDISHFKSEDLNNAYIYDIYRKYKDALFVVIIDLFDVFCLEKDDLLDAFDDYDTVLVINKTDILPENISDEKLEKILIVLLKKLRVRYPKIKAAIMTNRYEHHFNEKFFETIDETGKKQIVFAGRANAGKSTLINKLLHEEVLTTSVYPGTTLNESIISYEDYTFIDTPGLLDQESYTTYLDLQMNKKMKIAKAIKPQIFQFNSPQSYFYEGLLRADVIPKKKASIIFYVSNEIHIHRSPIEKADKYYQNNKHSFTLKAPLKPVYEDHIADRKIYVVKGLGMFKVTGKCDIKVHLHPDVRLYESEVDI